MDPPQTPQRKQRKTVPFLDLGSAVNTLSKSPDQELFAVAGRSVFKVVSFQHENGTQRFHLD